MDQLWKELKGDLAANRQFKTIDQAADYAETWVLAWSPRQALKKAGTLSKNYWLKHLLKNFCKPTQWSFIKDFRQRMKVNKILKDYVKNIKKDLDKNINNKKI